MVAIEEIRQQAAVQIAKVEEAAQAKYDSAMNDFRREVAARVSETEKAALKEYNEVVENVRREAVDRVAQADEKVTKATDRAEAAATSAAETYNQVQALMKQLLDTNARAGILEKAAADATLRAEMAEEEVKQMKRHLETTTGMGSEVFRLPIQEEDDRDWAMGETEGHDQLDALEPSRAVRSEDLVGQLPQAMSKAMQAMQNTHSINMGPRTQMNEMTGPLKPVSSKHINQVYTNVELQCDTDMFDPDYAPGYSSHTTQKPYGGSSETKRATPIVGSSGGKKAEDKGKSRLIDAEDDERMGDSLLIPLENCGYEGRGSRRPESSVQTSHK
jgi:F0F1-type ATP synthase membrane subunit b/b'